MMGEVFELTGAMDAILTDDGPTNLYAVIEEAVDVANYCMMLWMLRGLLRGILRGMLRGLSRMRSWSVPWENSRRRASKEERKCQFDTVLDKDPENPMAVCRGTCAMRIFDRILNELKAVKAYAGGVPDGRESI